MQWENLPLFVQTLPEKDKPYVVYYADLPYFPGARDVAESKEIGHACEIETSVTLHIHPELVKMEQIPPQPFSNLHRNQPLVEAGVYSPVDWYSMYPIMYVGDASKATAEKGRVIQNNKVEDLVKLIRAVKEDQVTPALMEEFRARKQKPTLPDLWKHDPR